MVSPDSTVQKEQQAAERAGIRAHHRWIGLAGICCAVVICAVLGGREAWVHHRRHMQREWYVLHLAMAINYYFQDTGMIPEDLATIESTDRYWEIPRMGGIDPRQVHREAWAHYLSAPMEGFVVAVVGKPYQAGNRRGYAVLGDMSARYATQEELEVILNRDDARRAAEGVPGRWASIDWKD